MRIFVPILIWQLCLIVDSEEVLISSGCGLMLNGFVHRWFGSIESKVNEGLINTAKLCSVAYYYWCMMLIGRMNVRLQFLGEKVGIEF